MVRHAWETAAEVAADEEKKSDSSKTVEVVGQFIVWARTWLFAVGLGVLEGVTQVLLSAFLAFFLLRDTDILAERLSV